MLPDMVWLDGCMTNRSMLGTWQQVHPLLTVISIPRHPGLRGKLRDL